MTTKGFLRASAAAAVILISSLAATAGQAQSTPQATAETDADTGGLAEIVVTATRRTESLQNVGLAVTSIGAADLAKSGVVNTQDIAALVPNMSVNFGISSVAFNIRGIGSNEFAINLDSPVATQVDEVYISKTFMTGLFNFDLERVEVSNGPQGTLFGRNTTGGAVNFYTRKPTDQFGAGGTLEYGNYQALRGEAYINTPLTEQLSARVSGYVLRQGKGYYDNLTLGTDEGYERKWAVRGQLRYDGGDTKVLLSGHFGRDRSSLAPYEGAGIYTPQSYAALNPTGGFANIGLLTPCAQYGIGTVSPGDANCVRGNDGRFPGDNDPYTSNGNQKHYTNNRTTGGYARIDHDFGGATLTSLSAYEYFKRDQSEVGDGSPDYSGTLLYWYATMKQFTQELRLTSNGNGPWTYVVGAFYEHDSLYNGDYLTFGSGPTPHLGGVKTSFDQKLDAIAFFVHNNVELTPTLKLVAGGRYNRERVEINGTNCGGAGSTGVGPGGRDKGEENPTTGCAAVLSTSALVPEGNVRKDDNVSFKLGYEWRPRVEAFDSLLMYGNVATGFRSGGFSADLADSQAAFTSLKPEEITSYELGFKSELADRRFRLNGAIFHYIFRNGYLSVDTPTSIVPITVNAAKIKAYGAELGAVWAPIRGLQFSTGGGYTNAKIKSDLTSAGVSLLNNRPVNSPRFTFNAAADFTTPVSDGLKLNANINANWRSSQYLEASNIPSTREPGYWLVNASVGIAEIDDRWSLTGFVRNLGDKSYRTYVNDLFSFGWTLNQYGVPRTYGLRASMKF
jgi:iron complex outermembrane recepter protein